MQTNRAPVLRTVGATIVQDSGIWSAVSTPSSIALQPDGSILLGTNKILVRYRADGSLDTGFGANNGLAATLSNWPSDIAVQADGKILVSGLSATDRTVILQRFDASGQPDLSFGGGSGHVRSEPGTYYSGFRIHPQADGRIVHMVASDNSDATQLVTVTRYLSNGTPDPSFGNAGSLRIDSKLISVKYFPTADGGFRLIGSDKYASSGHDIKVLGYDSNGQPDRSFGNAGTLTLDRAVDYSSAALGADGKFTLAAIKTIVNTSESVVSQIELYRVNPDGSLDQQFGQGGVVKIPVASFGSTAAGQPGKHFSNVPAGLHLGSDGKIVLAGVASMTSLQQGDAGEVEREGQQFVWRLLADGTPDLTFGAGGHQSVSYTGYLNATLVDSAVDARGNIALAGIVDSGSLVHGTVAMLDANGRPDAGFANPTPDSNAIDYRSAHPAVALNARIGVSDADLDALAGGTGNYAGATLTLGRHGGASSADGFSASGKLRLQDGHALVDGVDIGTATEAGGMFTLAFNANATQARVNLALQSLSYRNMAPADAGKQLQLDWTFNDGQGGSSSFPTSVRIAASAAPYWIEALLPGSSSGADAPAQRASYQGLLGAGNTIKLHFPGPDAVPGLASYRSFGEVEQSYVWKAARMVESLTGLRFVAGSERTSDSISFYSWTDDGHRASASYPNPSGATVWAKLALGQIAANSSIQVGTLVHEFGHALGMQHPFDYQHDGPTLPQFEADRKWSMMAYSDSRSVLEVGQIMFSPLDIATLQYLYGVNPASRAGNDTYQLSATAPNFIWDGAGTDTISGAGLSHGMTLQLTAGRWDYVGARGPAITSNGQVTINFGTQIENAIGTDGHDTITGNELANALSGGDGNDTLAGGAGDDTLDGGFDLDTALFSGRRADYELISQGGTLRVRATSGSDGTDLVRNTETLAFADAALPVQYHHIVQALYVAYFGRAADSAGLANFQSQLAALHAPQDIGDFRAACQSSASLRALLDTFGTSAESQALYAGGTDTFVTAIFRNLLNRAPDSTGLAFWSGEIDSGQLSRANASLAIMAGALSNVSAQGLRDAMTVQHKVDVAANFSFAIDSDAEALCYAGDFRAAAVRAMLARVDADTDVLAFQQTVVDTLAGLPLIKLIGSAPPPALDF